MRFWIEMATSTAPDPRPSYFGTQFGLPSARKDKASESDAAALVANRKLRFPVKDLEPASPRLEMSAEVQQAWKRRMARPTPSQFPEEIDSDEEFERDEEKVPLDWYGPLLQNVCCHSAILMNDRISVLMRQGKRVFEMKHLWELLVEVVDLFQCASYHIGVFSSLLSREAGAVAPCRPSQPRNVEGALSTLHLSVAKVQLHGQRLSTTLKRFYGPGSHEDEMYVSLTSSGKDVEEMIRRLLTIVPFLEHAVSRAGVLVHSCETARSVDTALKVAMAAGKWKRRSTLTRAMEDGP